MKLTVKRHPNKQGYTLYHDQPIGWNGTTKKHFGWYKYKSDAVNRKQELTR